MQRFSNRLALVTGAAAGIGLATARQLANDGARLILADRDESALGNATAELGAAIAGTICGDVGEEALWDEHASQLQGLDIAVINAGIASGGEIVDLAFAEWRRILSANLDGAFLTWRAAMRAMAGRGGAIVLTASVSALRPQPGTAAYGASKAGLIHLMKVAAKEGSAQGIRVNAIAPGGVETAIWRGIPMFEDMVCETGSEAAAFEALGKLMVRYAKPEEIAAQIAFLLSDEAANIIGAVLTSDGGYSL